MRFNDAKQHRDVDSEQQWQFDPHFDRNLYALRLPYFNTVVNPIIDELDESELDTIRIANLKRDDYCDEHQKRLSEHISHLDANHLWLKHG